ncbi:UbiD family decarboxylase [Paenibacillus sp. EPM92]|uniref:UbiD family decarboxylase n=1 Tax=Paenibacillus sp. EPM92 TaxID=1561195 RepID=UPI0019168099|nr:UbiD family decarboxylase [Paenibacillus sp. EPM92]
MSEVSYNDLREYIDACKAIDNWREILDADWNEEIGALTEATAELIPDPPMLMFDRIKDYPAGMRVVSLLLSSPKRVALSLGLPLEKSKLELVRLAARKIKEVKALPPVEVLHGPIMENVMTGEDVNILRFPVPLFHQSDGGRYIGTGDSVINRDPESGYVNMGTYRIQVHDRNLLGLWMSPGQQGRQICQKYWDRGKSCPIVATFGGDPLTFMASHSRRPWGKSELEFVGGLRGRPLEVIKGPITGLPIPAYAEIAIEGEVPPPGIESHPEGPFGEWPGYYSGGTVGTGELQPVIRIKAIYHRNNPIILSEAPLWPGAPKYGLPIGSGVLWDQLEGAGIQDIAGVYNHDRYFIVIAIRQRYAGHAKQAGLAALGCAEAARHGRYIVIVDEDIDPSNMKEVLWALKTRVDPATDIEIVDGCLSTPIDPVMSPEKRESRNHTSSRAIFYAVRPFTWKDKFPKSSRAGKDLQREVMEKYKSVLSFPTL